MAQTCRLLAAFFVLLFASVGANAGDFAQREIIGFSPDGAYFAFEEYGVQDGSGFPYSTIYVIDVAKDDWVPDSPKRFRIDDEQATLADARGEARQQARFLLQQYDTRHQGNTIASNHYTHENADPYKVTFRPRLVVPPIDKPMTLALDQYKLPGKQICADIGSGDTKGFRLTLTGTAGPRVLHEDARIPGSRTCPLDYRIHDVITYYPEGGGSASLAVIIQMVTPGFEGADGRFLAVTARLN